MKGIARGKKVLTHPSPLPLNGSDGGEGDRTGGHGGGEGCRGGDGDGPARLGTVATMPH